jgi:hypothetical protein
MRHRPTTVPATNGRSRQRAAAPDAVEDLLRAVEDPLCETWLRRLLEAGEVASWEIRPEEPSR